ncbi:hypothetical protein AURDEDRAFT_170713 [Auricularia subglabra TFB-10046 SS5]|uniref:Nudix hydrolase domain-containing protein n=1 Tax=Auricularia subglabra (strain TFB-10046 / SS5) TaxID=717982 RepID=J0WWD3_AURST|nr:hypothetical protein AURDEDRAFT_170713 [Auricularia subglabra TFB-10046 SS5]
MSLPVQRPRPIPTENSSRFVTNAFWLSADCVVEIGAVLIDRRSECVLLVHDDARKQYILPRVTRKDFDVLLQAPFQAVGAKVGIPCTALALPRIEKKTLVPPDGNWYNATAMEIYSRTQTTTNPFHLSIGTLWTTDKTGKWPDGYQLITYWYGGEITALPEQRSAPSQQPGVRLATFDEALEMLKGKDDPAWSALSQFAVIWTNAKKLASGSTDLV